MIAKEGGQGESEDEDEEDNVVRMRWNTEEEEETGEGEWGNVHTMKRGERYEIKNKEDGSVNKVKILGSAGKVSSKK